MFRRILACGLVSMMLLPAISRSDEASELSDVILRDVAEHLPSGATPLTEIEMKDVRWTTQVFSKLAYYPLELPQAKQAISESISKAASPGDAIAGSLARVGLSTMLDQIGHGAQLLPWSDDNTKKSADKPEPPEMSIRQVGSLRVISMPQLAMPILGDPFCKALKQPTTDAYDAIVLDLRGNGGGDLRSVSTIASQFLDPDLPLFRLAMRGGTTEEFKTRRCESAPLKLPLAVLIDERTNGGAVLLAAVLQDLRRATVIGQSTVSVKGTVDDLRRAPSGTFYAIVPSGELFFAGNRRLADGIRVDVQMPTQDEEALLNAARANFGSSE